MSEADKQYRSLLRKIVEYGNVRGDRTGTGTVSIFGHQLRFNLQAGFPILTTKKVHFKSVKAELLWMISGSTNVRDLQKLGCTIWDEWADEAGELGPVYGHQWRSVYNPDWADDAPGAFDQLGMAIEEIQTNPESRRIIVDAWNVPDLPFMRLPPCHMLYQFYVADGRLSCSMYQRSADVFLGLPFNIAQYALLTHLVAEVTELGVGDLIISLGDAHIYRNHMDQVFEQYKRAPRSLPTLELAHRDSIDDFTMDDILLVGYDPHPAIKAEVAV